jgi:hypothetical protein
MIKHRLIEIGRYDARVYRNPRSHRSRQNSSARGRFQHILRLGFGYSLGQIERIERAGAEAIFPPGTVIAEAAAHLLAKLNARLGHGRVAAGSNNMIFGRTSIA